MTAVPAEQSRAGYTLLTLRAAGAHLGFGAFALARSLLWPSSTCAHSTFFTNYHTTDLHVSYSDVQGEITVLIAYLSCLTSCSEIWMEEKNFCVKECWHQNAKQS